MKLKIRIFKPMVEPWDVIDIRITIFGLTLFGLAIGKFVALTFTVKGIIITLFGFTIQITNK